MSVAILVRAVRGPDLSKVVNLGTYFGFFSDTFLVGIGEPIGFRSRFSQCVDYMRFNEKSFCFR